MGARVDLDAVDLTALVETYAERIWEEARASGAIPADEPAWADLTAIRRHGVREVCTKPVHNVLSALREQATS